VKTPKTEKRAALVKQAQTLVDDAEKRGEWTNDDQENLNRLNAEIRDLDGTVDVRNFNGALTQVSGRDDRAESVLLTREQRMQDWHRERTGGSLDAEGESREDFNIARFLRGVIEPDTRGSMSDYEQRAVVIGTSADGGVLFPEVWSARLIDAARKKARLFEAGASTLPMQAQKVHLPRLAAGVAPAWRGEGSAIAEDTGTFDMVELDAKFLGVICKISIEALDDATPEAAALIEGDIAKSLALELDRVGLYGSGASNQPTGVKTALDGGAQEIAADTLDSYAQHVKALAKVKAGNFEPNALVYSPGNDEKASLLVDTTGQPLRMPPAVEKVSHLVTAQAADAEIFAAEWANLVFGIRSNVGVRLLSERYIADGFYGLVCWLRADVALMHDEAFSFAGITA
jgi:HK97 family phage major capsid protein